MLDNELGQLRTWSESSGIQPLFITIRKLPRTFHHTYSARLVSLFSLLHTVA